MRDGHGGRGKRTASAESKRFHLSTPVQTWDCCVQSSSHQIVRRWRLLT